MLPFNSGESTLQFPWLKLMVFCLKLLWNDLLFPSVETAPLQSETETIPLPNLNLPPGEAQGKGKKKTRNDCTRAVKRISPYEDQVLVSPLPSSSRFLHEIRVKKEVHPLKKLIHVRNKTDIFLFFSFNDVHCSSLALNEWHDWEVTSSLGCPCIQSATSLGGASQERAENVTRDVSTSSAKGKANKWN